MIEEHGKRFYFHRLYFTAQQIFVMYVTMAENSSEADKYLAKVTLKDPDDERKSLSITKNVISMEGAPSDEDSVLAHDRVVFVSWWTMRGFLVHTNETKDGTITYKSTFENSIEILFN